MSGVKVSQNVCETCNGQVEVGVAGLVICTSCGRRSIQERLSNNYQYQPTSTTNNDYQRTSNYLQLAEHALESRNFAEAESYANKVIEADPSDYRAWMVKGRASGWQSSLQKLRLQEASTAFLRALSCVPEDQSDSAKSQATTEMVNLALATIETRGKLYVEHPDPDQADGFLRDIKEIVSATRTLLDRTDTAADYMWEEIASLINGSVVDAWTETIWKEFTADRYPDDFDFDRFRERVPCAIELLETAIGLNANDSSRDIVRYNNIILFCERLRDAKSYTFTGREYEVSRTITREAKNVNNERIAQCRREVARLERAEQEEADRAERETVNARREAYWSSPENRKEKQRLDARQRELEDQLMKLKDQEASIPGLSELTEIKAQIAKLRKEYESTGVFDRTQRKTIKDKLKSSDARKEELHQRVSEPHNRIRKQISEVERELEAITKELTMPR